MRQRWALIQWASWSVILAAAGSSAAEPPEGRAEFRLNELARSHWAFQPLTHPVPPAGGDPVAAFVGAGLKTKGLKSSPPARARDWIRRAYFDLTGLPPTPEEVAAFERDSSPEREARVVERLLASPQYGERWGRHWLDIARYTESTGFEYDRLRDNAWPYRDYVIQSFNQDKPYDRFMQEQIAGDVLEPITSDGLIATSLLVCGPYDQAGNAQANATQRAITREEEMEDLLSVVGQTFLGLTINCARCHNHKFDPIPQVDYYRIKSVFDGVKHGERSIENAVETREREAQVAALNREVAAAQEVVTRIEAEGARKVLARRVGTPSEPGPAPYARWTFDAEDNAVLPGKPREGASITAGRLLLPKAGAHFQTEPLRRDIREKTLEAWVSLTDLEQAGGGAISLENLDGSRFDALVFGERQPRKWMAGSEGFVRTRNLEAPEETVVDKVVQLVAVYRADNSIALFRNGVPYGQPYTPESPLQTFRAGEAHVVLGLRHKGGGRPWLVGALDQAALYDRALTDAEVLASFRSGGTGIPLAELLASLEEGPRNEREAAIVRAKRVAERAEKLKKPRAMAYAGIRVQPPATKLLLRGDVTKPGEVVVPAALTFFEGILPAFGLSPEAPEAERRMKFAKWLADPRNPLPARVLANRVWQFHFGQGLVSTPSDFGISGAKPTHPELLDWLAAKLIDSGWSVKALHRVIMNSATYRQDSGDTKSEAAKENNQRALTVDVDNQSLWRFTPRRLEAEAVRDAMLAVSGQLNLQMGGPSFRPFTTTEFNATFYHPFDKGDAEYSRRTVYRMNVNSGKEPLLDAFDCPDPSVKTPRRGVTTTPLQALGLMNSAFVQRQSGHLAQRALKLANQDLSRAVEVAYRLALGRPATIEERDRALTAARERNLSHVCWALLNSTEFVYVR